MQLSAEVILFAKGISELPRTPGLRNQPRALVVGTSPLGDRHSRDVDWEIYGVPAAKAKQHLEDLARAQQIRIECFGGNAYLLAIVTDRSGVKYDVSLPVTEEGNVQRYSTGVVRADPDLSFKEAAKRRDFTFTAIGIDPLTQELIDPFQGRADFEKGLLRAVNLDRIGGDPLQFLRAMRFVSVYGFTMDEPTANAMRARAAQLDLSPQNARMDRLRYELMLLFSQRGKVSQGLELGFQLGIVQPIFPELVALRECCQSSAKGGPDLWQKLLQSADRLAEKVELAELPVVQLANLAAFAGNCNKNEGVVKVDPVRLIRELCHDEKIISAVESRWEQTAEFL